MDYIEQEDEYIKNVIKDLDTLMKRAYDDDCMAGFPFSSDQPLDYAEDEH